MKRVITALFSVFALTAQAADCFQFAGQKYCPVGDGAQKPVPCESASCLTPDYSLKLPKTGQTVYVAPPTVVAPTDADGKPSKFVNACSQYGCSVSQAPVVVEPYVPSPPPTVWWYQPAPVAVPTVIMWGPMQGTGPWGLPSGPPLRRHR
jgi:hypothetical protein